jgi:hypothetical protein
MRKNLSSLESTESKFDIYVDRKVRLLLGHDENRVQATIHPPTFCDVYLTLSVSEYQDAPIRLGCSSRPFVLNQSAHGRLVQKEVWAVSPRGSQLITVMVKRNTSKALRNHKLTD